MANRYFTAGRHYVHQNGLSGKDVRVLLVMTNTDVDTLAEASVDFVNSFTLDEHDGSAYVRKQLTESFSRDNTNVRSEFTASVVTWAGLGAGTRAIEGVLMFVFITNDTDSVPLGFYDTTNVSSNGGDVTFSANAEGLLQL